MQIGHCRLLASECGLVQRVRDMRRARLFGIDPAHVLHQSGPVSGHQIAATCPAQQAVRVQKNGLGPCRARVASRSAHQLPDQRARSDRHVQHHDRRSVRHQQPRFRLLRLAGGFLRAHDHHGRLVRAHCPTAQDQSQDARQGDPGRQAAAKVAAAAGAMWPARRRCERTFRSSRSARSCHSDSSVHRQRGENVEIESGTDAGSESSQDRNRFQHSATVTETTAAATGDAEHLERRHRGQ